MPDLLKLRPEQLCIYFVTASVLLLGGVYFLQNIIGLVPCELCLWQRYPYFIALFGAVLVPLHMEMVALYGQIIAFGAGAIIALYHSGIERHLWDGFSSCSGSVLPTQDNTALLARLEETPLVKCDEISFALLGVSLSNMNLIVSAALCVVGIMWILNNKESL